MWGGNRGALGHRSPGTTATLSAPRAPPEMAGQSTRTRETKQPDNDPKVDARSEKEGDHEKAQRDSSWETIARALLNQGSRQKEFQDAALVAVADSGSETT